jgi:hypothetical protein
MPQKKATQAKKETPKPAKKSTAQRITVDQRNKKETPKPAKKSMNNNSFAWRAQASLALTRMDATLSPLIHAAISFMHHAYEPAGKFHYDIDYGHSSVLQRLPKCLIAVSRATRSFVLHRFVADSTDVLTQVLWLKPHTVGVFVRSAADVAKLRTMVAVAHTVTFDRDAPEEAYAAVSRQFPNVTAMYGVTLTTETAPYVAAMTRLEALHCTLSRLAVDELLLFVADCPRLVDLDVDVASSVRLAVAGRDAAMSSPFAKVTAMHTYRSMIETRDWLMSEIRKVSNNGIDEGRLNHLSTILKYMLTHCPALCVQFSVAHTCDWVITMIGKSQYEYSMSLLCGILESLLKHCPELRPHFATKDTRERLLTMIAKEKYMFYSWRYF